MTKILEASLSYYSSKERERDDESAQKQKEQKLRMKHGKNWKQFIQDVESAKNKLKPGEVRKWDPEQNKYVSNRET